MTTLRMMAVGGPLGGPMVPDYQAQAAGRRQYHGRKLDSSQGSVFESREIVKGPNGKTQIVTVQRRNAVFVPHEEAVFEVADDSPFVSEYLRHLREGDLLPADQATADEAHVKFDPTFARSLHRVHAANLAAKAAGPAPGVVSAAVAASVKEALKKPLPGADGSRS